MPTIDFTQEELNLLTQILADQPWKIANPILYKMARQQTAQIPSAEVTPLRGPSDGPGKPADRHRGGPGGS